ncbi:MAG: alpha/beta fold hydrolase [Isosphaeraceae bacterium]
MRAADARREPPTFVPLPFLRGGHAQTIAGRYFWNGDPHLASERHEIALDDGDRLCVLSSTPPAWSPGGPVAILVHGLAGSAGAPYVVRLARRLLAQGVGVVRMNLRGAGEGFGLARGIYHAGRSDDVRQVVSWMARRAPDSALALIGFSLGAGLVLKLAGEAAERPVPCLDCVVAANPPVDLAACAEAMRRPQNRIYDWNFVRWLRREVSRLHRTFPELGDPGLGGVRSVYEFDDRYTAPRNGFASADDYYRRSSALSYLSRIEHPASSSTRRTIRSSRPGRSAARDSRRLVLELVRHGGHLGYVAAAAGRETAGGWTPGSRSAVRAVGTPSDGP